MELLHKARSDPLDDLGCTRIVRIIALSQPCCGVETLLKIAHPNFELRLNRLYRNGHHAKSSKLWAVVLVVGDRPHVWSVSILVSQSSQCACDVAWFPRERRGAVEQDGLKVQRRLRAVDRIDPVVRREREKVRDEQ